MHLIVPCSSSWLFLFNTQATLIVNNVHLHILPSMNPDGFDMRRRGNANNVDLNRDFPDQVSSHMLYSPSFNSCFLIIIDHIRSSFCLLHNLYFICTKIACLHLAVWNNKWWQFYPLNDGLTQRQPETKAIIKWVEGRQFTASASLHGVRYFI